MPSRRASQEIVRSPGICGSRPRIKGTRITVDHLVSYAQILGGPDVEGLLRAFPHLTRRQVEVAFDYYEANREEIDGIIERRNKDLLREGQSPYEPAPF